MENFDREIAEGMQKIVSGVIDAEKKSEYDYGYEKFVEYVHLLMEESRKNGHGMRLTIWDIVEGFEIILEYDERDDMISIEVYLSRENGELTDEEVEAEKNSDGWIPFRFSPSMVGEEVVRENYKQMIKSVIDEKNKVNEFKNSIMKSKVTKKELDAKFKELQMSIPFMSEFDMMKKIENFKKMRSVVKKTKDRIAGDPAKHSDLLMYIDILNYYTQCIAFLQESIDELESFGDIEDLEIID